MATKQSLSVAVPWSLSHYIALNGFHPLYRALFDHTPQNVILSAWDNVKLYRCFQSDASLGKELLCKAKGEKSYSDRMANKSIARAYEQYFWPPNRVLTTELMGDIEFHHTAPFPSLRRPFVLHCEMFAPAWYPFSQQGSGPLQRAGEIREHYRSIFASPLCLGVFSHVPETLHSLSQFFSDPIIDRKLFPSRIGLSAKAVSGRTLSAQASLQCPRFLFVNSANQNPSNFFRRGGHIVLRFWKEYLAEGRGGLLMLRCTKPSEEELVDYGVDVSFIRSQTGRSIIWGQDYLANHEMNALMESAHFFLLPSASLHSVSIMQAMTLGSIPVVTDTVGTSVYVTDTVNGIVLRGMREAIWAKDAVTGILVDQYSRIPALDDDLVSQLTRRICGLLERPESYGEMRQCMMSFAQERFSGQAFSDQFWSAVSSLYQRCRDSNGASTMVPCPERRALFNCTLQSNEWSRVFESPTQPRQKINTGHSAIWEVGGALIHTYGNPSFTLSDWSVLARYYSGDAPLITFAHTLEELGGRYLGLNRSVGGNLIYKSVAWVSGVLRPHPWLYRYGALIWSKMRRYYVHSSSRSIESAVNNFDIELVREGVFGYNIIRHIDRYYAIPQAEGAFVPSKVDLGGYSSCFSGQSLSEVERSIIAAHGSKLGIADAHEEATARASER